MGDVRIVGNGLKSSAVLTKSLWVELKWLIFKSGGASYLHQWRVG